MSERAAAGLALGVGLVLAACSSTPAAPPATGPRAGASDARGDGSTETPMNKTPRPPPLFEVGPTLAPRAALVAWLDQQGPTAIVRVPVALTVSPLGVTAAAVGAGADQLALELDEGALGEGLADRAAEFCGDAPTCTMWLWGHWQAGTLRVIKAEGAVAADDASATHAFVAR